MCSVCVCVCVSGSIFPAYRPSDTVFKITFWLGYFNSCINPIIYPCSNQEFRKAFLSVLGARCLRRRTTPTHQPTGHGQSQLLSLGQDNRPFPPRLSASSSMALSRTPSSRDGREWRAVSRTSSVGMNTRTKVAGVCSKNLLRTCCCLGTETTGTPRPSSSLPIIKIHQLSLCEKGDAV